MNALRAGGNVLMQCVRQVQKILLRRNKFALEGCKALAELFVRLRSVCKHGRRLAQSMREQREA